jgi:hypothetical protein
MELLSPVVNHVMEVTKLSGSNTVPYLHFSMGLASTGSIFRLAQGQKIGQGTFVSQRTGGY